MEGGGFERIPRYMCVMTPQDPSPDPQGAHARSMCRKTTGWFGSQWYCNVIIR